MKKGLVITGIALIIFSTISIINVTEGQSGAGLYGMLTFYLIMLTISGVLIYFGARQKKENTLHSGDVRETNQSSKYNDNYEILKDLHKKGILTDDEYYEKSAKLKSETLQSEIKQTPEYKKLKSLYNNGILTEEEFINKTKNISYDVNQKKNVANKEEENIQNKIDYISMILIVAAVILIIYIYVSIY